MSTPDYGPTLYGTATVGPKGQIVIPGDARKALELNPGDKVIVMGVGHDGKMIGICPAARIENILTHMSSKLDKLRSALEAEPQKPDSE